MPIALFPFRSHLLRRTCGLQSGRLQDLSVPAFERVCELEPEFEGINEKLTVLYMTLHDKENFIKYNQKCTRPFDLKELEKMQAMMENEDREDLAVYMQNIIKALQ